MFRASLPASVIVILFLVFPLHAADKTGHKDFDAKPFAEPPESVLFLGNSFTYKNNLPAMLGAIASANGKTLATGKVAKPGLTIHRHSRIKDAQVALASREWDVMVLQGMSVEPIFFRKKMIEGAKVLAAKCGKARPMVFMTWAYKTDKTFIKKWGGKNGFTAEDIEAMHPKMQDILEEGYREMAKAINANVAPVGLAWEAAQKKHPDWELYLKDEYHPGPLGTYLSALVFYRCLYGSLPQKAPALRKLKIDRKTHEEMLKLIGSL